MDPLDHTSNIKLDDARKIVEISNPATLGFNSDTTFWRGHGDAEWHLLPHVFRRDPSRPQVPKYDECALIGHFVARAPTRSHMSMPHRDDYFGWLFLAQHYGLPTRLLDWTENPLVALYFAALEHEEDRDGCIWALWPDELNKRFGCPSLAMIRDPRVYSLAQPAFIPGLHCEDAVLAIDGQEIDQRMLVQMGRFTVHTYHTAIEDLPFSVGWLRKYILPKRLDINWLRWA